MFTVKGKEFEMKITDDSRPQMVVTSLGQLNIVLPNRLTFIVEGCPDPSILSKWELIMRANGNIVFDLNNPSNPFSIEA